VLLAFWAMSLSHERLRQAYTKHLVTWREGLHEYLRQGREDGQIVTPTPDEELVDELVLINAGANAMVVVGPEYTTTELQLAHLDAFFARLRRRR
ncbi:MAG: TetR family transcriptional regulator C-terminal domain-containing protein, partial [Actinobacteria bacterium]|nr:TetR family transcriptional regulator C-terminal domain-containing protein [Actinomycetota bacterium]